MTTITIERIRAALKAGPTMGEWASLVLETAVGTPFGIITGGAGEKRDTVICHGPDYTDERKSFNAFRSANGEYIASCNPSAMAEVLDHIDALTAENERLTECLKKANAQAEHFEREWYLRGDELERLRKDADRYQFIRDADRSDCVWREICIYAMETLDEYIDAAMDGEKAMKGTP